MACKVIWSFDQNSELEMTLPAIYVQFAKPSSIDSLESREYIRCGRRILNWDGHLPSIQDVRKILELSDLPPLSSHNLSVRLYRALLKGFGQVWGILGGKIAFSCLLLLVVPCVLLSHLSYPLSGRHMRMSPNVP